ncbi:MAG: hypothetical protein QNJ09_14825 [Paracoccaceae bacterium]|nr:hypothetical protein [Paracoccaceae bacterium]
MKHLLLTLFLMLPAAAQAEFKLSDMVGNWSGSGQYYEKPTRAKMQCRLTITGGDAKVTLSGRCGSTLGSETMKLDFIRQGGGSVIVRNAPGAPRNTTDIGQLTGRMSGNFLVVSGSAGPDAVTIQFEKKADGQLHFVTDRKWKENSGQSSVMLVRR